MAEGEQGRNIITWGLENGIVSADDVLVQAYETVAYQLIAVLQATGPVEVPEDWIERSKEHVAQCEPIPGGGRRFSAITRDEAGRVHLDRENRRAQELVEDG